MIKNDIRTFIFIIFILLLTGCSYEYTGATSTIDRRVHIFAVRQFPMAPTYNRIKTVHLASPLPSRVHHPVSNKVITPVFQFEAEDSTFEEVALILANTAKYSSYCAPEIANKKVSIVTLGTIDEIANEIEQETGIVVKIDHTKKEVKFLENK